MIVNQHGFKDDVAYGKSKLFGRTPRTLFTLEQERAALIPILVLFLQKVGAPSDMGHILTIDWTLRPRGFFFSPRRVIKQLIDRHVLLSCFKLGPIESSEAPQQILPHACEYVAPGCVCLESHLPA